jgi:hypothetical protein
VGEVPFTPAVRACYGLVEALRGIEGAIPTEESSVVLRAFRLPTGTPTQRCMMP